MLATSLLSLALLGVAGLLLDSHRTEWRLAAGSGGNRRVRQFAQSRRRRRTAATAMIALAGGLVALWPVTPRTPWSVVGYAALLAGLAAAILLLGVLDAVASGRYYRDESRRRVAEQFRLLAELASTERSRATPPAEGE